jgi:electron transfer flavoprotein beta subunit
LKIVALVKNVPDTEAKIKINADASGIDPQGIKFVMNPYDEYAVEEALRIKEKNSDATVTVISLGPDRVVEGLRTALAMGADEAVHVSDDAFDGGDSQANGRVLAETIKLLGEVDLVLGGKQGIDFDAGQTCAAVAEYLDIPQALIVTELTFSDDGKTATARRRIEGGDEIVEMQLPALVTCEKGINEPRYASLPGIMKAKKKEIRKIALGDLPLEAGQTGAAAAQASIVKFHPLPERSPVKMIEGEPAEQVKELVRLLREEAKII